MKYKGIELKEVTEPQIFTPPRKMLAWDRESDGTPIECYVYAIVNRGVDSRPVICKYATFTYCAEIPDSKSKPVTYRELARWLAEGNGQYRRILTTGSAFTYANEDDNNTVDELMDVRKWNDTEWHKPTREYLGLEY